MMTAIRRLAGAALMLCAAAPALAQDAPAADQLRVFVDCSYYCDMDFMRTEITWIDYMRDRADAQVHVLVSRESTGGGGSRYTAEFIGLRQFAGRADTLTYTASADATSEIVRQGLTRTIKLGLVPFVAGTPAAQRLNVSFEAAPAATTAAPSNEPQRDPWNYWTFRLGMNGNSNGETQQSFTYLSGNVNANRTTADWKMDFGLRGSYNESRFEYEIDGELTETSSINKNYSANALVVKSLGPNLSAGLSASANTSTFGNTSLGVTIAPAVEYNFIPYSESTRRQFTVRYSAGMRYADYREVTIFGEVQETRPNHSLNVNYFTRQPWGSISIGVDGAQYLHDTKKYNMGIGGGTDVRLFKGFSFNVGGNYSHIRDQLSLPGRELTEEEILLRQRQLATGYNYFIYWGVSYRFGSIFNNVVNPRFGGGGDGMIIMM